MPAIAGHDKGWGKLRKIHEKKSNRGNSGRDNRRNQLLAVLEDRRQSQHDVRTGMMSMTFNFIILIPIINDIHGHINLIRYLLQRQEINP